MIEEGWERGEDRDRDGQTDKEAESDGDRKGAWPPHLRNDLWRLRVGGASPCDGLTAPRLSS